MLKSQNKVGTEYAKSIALSCLLISVTLPCHKTNLLEGEFSMSRALSACQYSRGYAPAYFCKAFAFVFNGTIMLYVLRRQEPAALQKLLDEMVRDKRISRYQPKKPSHFSFKTFADCWRVPGPWHRMMALNAIILIPFIALLEGEFLMSRWLQVG